MANGSRLVTRTTTMSPNGELVDVAEGTNGGYVFTIKDAAQVIRSWLWAIVLVTLLVSGITLGYSLLQIPTYQANVQVLVGQEPNSSPYNPMAAQDLQSLTQTMTEVIKTRPIAEAAIQQLNLEMSPESVIGNLTAQQVKTTQLIDVSYKDTDPQRTQDIANSIGDVFSEQASEASTNGNPVTVTVWTQAELPSEPITPNTKYNFVIALVIGLILGTVLAFLMDYVSPPQAEPSEGKKQESS